MSRWRPPQPKSTRIITRAGFDALKTELDDLWRHQRPDVVKALAAAAAEGDRSENAEYTYRKKQLGQIDRRVRYLGKRIPSLKVIDTAPPARDTIFFGATVTVENADTGATRRYRIIGPDETDAGRGYISVDSPLARALLKKHVDDEVEADLPGGRMTLAVVAIDYGVTAE
jgi:transcription elongation factor GreB